MISLVAQCQKCGVRWATGAVRDVQGLGFAVALLAKSVEQGAPICIDCSGGTASDAEVKQHRRAVELAKGTGLPECPYCEEEENNCLCESGGVEAGFWGEDGLWHRKSLEERPS
jgi:hypothetical protein